MGISVGLDELLAQTDAAFRARFGREAEAVAAAPGRVNLIGEHVDYNEGFVLPAAIDRYTLVAAARLAEPLVRVVSSAMPDGAAIWLDAPLEPAERRWDNYIRGVFAGFQARGVTLPGLDLWIESTVPVGGGLSSSAALEVAVATLLEGLTGLKLAPDDKALLCQRAEHDFADVPCGIMDQFASVYGRRDHALLLDCRSRQLDYVPLADPDVSLLVFDTKVQHDLVQGEYARRRGACRNAAAALGVASLRDLSAEVLQDGRDRLDEEPWRCARHVVTEIARTIEAARAMASSDWARVAELMYASHASLRDDYRVSCPELDCVVETARRLPDVYGCRMTGGGFGGCAVALVRTDRTAQVLAELTEAYRRQTGREPSAFVTRPADGARRLRG
jgi:galactokinase